jgi:stage V sporulation protein D (sporulation-specific penicillin-binding protein)
VSRKSLNSRLYFIFLCFILFFSFLIIRLVYVQIFKSSQFRKIASEQHRVFTEIQPERGVIFDRKVKPLALNAISYSIFATNEASFNELIENDLDEVLNLDKEYIQSKVNLRKKFTWLKRKVSPEVASKIKDLGLSGIGQIRENKRSYPEAHLASHILGFTNIDNKGLEGIELYCDTYLAGMKGWRLASRDAKRRELMCWGYKTIPPTDGYNIILTIDSVIQNVTERHLRVAAKKYNALSATAIVMNPKNGEILALANYPDYDLNNFGNYDSAVRRNVAVTDMYEPGSSFKFITVAAALEENKVTPDQTFYCEKGEYATAGRILHDYKSYGDLTVTEIIEKSSNIGVAKIALLLGEETLHKYIKDFGFGELTDVNLPGEVAGLIRPVKSWSRVSISSLPMGQEIAVTPLQLITALSAVANDGILMKPKIIRFVQHKDGRVIKSFPTQEVRQIISADNAKALRKMMEGVVEHGTGKRARLRGYSAGGKTGTAQKPRPEGGYYKRKYVSSFIGFAPADNPLVCVLVMMDDPHPKYFGGTVCAPVFKKIATETLRYLDMSKSSEAIDSDSEEEEQ